MCNLVGGIMRNNSVKLFCIWANGSGGDVILKISYLELWQPSIYAILEEGIMGNIHVKLFEIWTSGSGGDVI